VGWIYLAQERGDKRLEPFALLRDYLLYKKDISVEKLDLNLAWQGYLNFHV
jgi:hypothetical protein